MPNENKTGAEEYIERVLDGRIYTSAEVVKLCNIMYPRIKHGYKEWHYSRACANRVVDFLRTACYIPSGKIGVKFETELYEQFIIGLMFGFVDSDDCRQIQETLVKIARKNGKTSLAAGLSHYMLLGDNEYAPQIYSVASTKTQASLCYGASLNMMAQSKLLRRRERKGVVADRKEDGIICDKNRGFISTLASNSATLDGLNTHFAIADEIAAWRDRGVYDLVKQASSSRSQPMLLEITTDGFVRNSIGDAQFRYAKEWLDSDGNKDDRFLPIVWQLDRAEDNWTDEGVWIKANPGLGTVKKLETLRGYVVKAKQDLEFLPTVLTKDFNIPQNESSAWLAWEECGSDEKFDFDSMHFDYCIVGFDAADSIDLTAAQALFMRAGDDHIYEKSMYWIPESKLQDAEERGATRNTDDVPYRLWEAQGLLRVVSGNNVPKSVLQEWIEELRDEHDVYTYAVGYDPWHMDDNTVKNLKLLVGESRVKAVRQGAPTLSEPMKRIKADYKDKRIIDNAHPINRWCRMNVMVKEDVNKNIQPDKKNNSAKNRIDGFMAELDAYVVLLNMYDEYRQAIS
ncbi:terminase large subunit [uncultured Olegusella sp.]|uniref:terminase large subunit n=1 Tax=uncultured Olegusella sp. TaxID=1979846 RepID=UPI00262D8BAC|nr:terminase large subunit [uncultured Olegusella sp.]